MSSLQLYVEAIHEYYHGDPVPSFPASLPSFRKLHVKDFPELMGKFRKYLSSQQVINTKGIDALIKGIENSEIGPDLSKEDVVDYYVLMAQAQPIDEVGLKPPQQETAKDDSQIEHEYPQQTTDTPNAKPEEVIKPKRDKKDLEQRVDAIMAAFQQLGIDASNPRRGDRSRVMNKAIEDSDPSITLSESTAPKAYQECIRRKLVKKM